MERREELGFPLGQVEPLPPALPGTPSGSLEVPTADFVMEIGTEELPPDDLDAAVEQLE